MEAAQKSTCPMAPLLSEHELQNLEDELIAAVYAVQGLLGGAHALAELGINNLDAADDDDPSSALLQVQHCVVAADSNLTALAKRIGVAISALQEGKPIGKPGLLGSGN